MKKTVSIILFIFAFSISGCDQSEQEKQQTEKGKNNMGEKKLYTPKGDKNYLFSK